MTQPPPPILSFTPPPRRHWQHPAPNRDSARTPRHISPTPSPPTYRCLSDGIPHPIYSIQTTPKVLQDSPFTPDAAPTPRHWSNVTTTRSVPPVPIPSSSSMATSALYPLRHSSPRPPRRFWRNPSTTIYSDAHPRFRGGTTGTPSTTIKPISHALSGADHHSQRLGADLSYAGIAHPTASCSSASPPPSDYNEPPTPCSLRSSPRGSGDARYSPGNAFTGMDVHDSHRRRRSASPVLARRGAKTSCFPVLPLSRPNEISPFAFHPPAPSSAPPVSFTNLGDALANYTPLLPFGADPALLRSRLALDDPQIRELQNIARWHRQRAKSRRLHFKPGQEETTLLGSLLHVNQAERNLSDSIQRFDKPRAPWAVDFLPDVLGNYFLADLWDILTFSPPGHELLAAHQTAHEMGMESLRIAVGLSPGHPAATQARVQLHEWALVQVKAAMYLYAVIGRIAQDKPQQVTPHLSPRRQASTEMGPAALEHLAVVAKNAVSLGGVGWEPMSAFPSSIATISSTAYSHRPQNPLFLDRSQPFRWIDTPPYTPAIPGIPVTAQPYSSHSYSATMATSIPCASQGPKPPRDANLHSAKNHPYHRSARAALTVPVPSGFGARIPIAQSINTPPQSSSPLLAVDSLIYRPARTAIAGESRFSDDRQRTSLAPSPSQALLPTTKCLASHVRESMGR